MALVQRALGVRRELQRPTLEHLRPALAAGLEVVHRVVDQQRLRVRRGGAQLQRQLQAVSCEASIGPERWLKWSVPEGTADPLGGLLHDDLVISAAMTAILDEQEWRISLPPQIIQAIDPLKEMDGGY